MKAIEIFENYFQTTISFICWKMLRKEIFISIWVESWMKQMKHMCKHLHLNSILNYFTSTKIQIPHPNEALLSVFFVSLFFTVNWEFRVSSLSHFTQFRFISSQNVESLVNPFDANNCLIPLKGIKKDQISIKFENC